MQFETGGSQTLSAAATSGLLLGSVPLFFASSVAGMCYVLSSPPVSRPLRLSPAGFEPTTGRTIPASDDRHLQMSLTLLAARRET